MSEFKKQFSARGIFILSLLFVFILSGFAPLPQDGEPGSIIDNILRIAASFASLAGVSAGVGVLVAFARAFGLVRTDEAAGKITAGLNLLAFGVLVYFGVFRPDLSLEWLDSTAAKIASIGLFILGLVVQMITPAPVLRGFYQSRVPVLEAVGARAELRAQAHYVRSMSEGKNWTTDPEELRKK